MAAGWGKTRKNWLPLTPFTPKRGNQPARRKAAVDSLTAEGGWQEKSFLNTLIYLNLR
jgi:hypothetical protein